MQEEKKEQMQQNVAERFGMEEETLEHAVRLGQAKLLESALAKLSKDTEAFIEALNAVKKKDKKAFNCVAERCGLTAAERDVTIFIGIKYDF